MMHLQRNLIYVRAVPESENVLSVTEQDRNRKDKGATPIVILNGVQYYIDIKNKTIRNDKTENVK